mgnify:CR=1 FL=1
MMHFRFEFALCIFIFLLPLLMGLGVQSGDEEEGGMGGTGHSVGVPIDFPETPEMPEILDELPGGIDIINIDVGPVDGADGIDVEAPEVVD